MAVVTTVGTAFTPIPARMPSFIPTPPASSARIRRSKQDRKDIVRHNTEAFEMPNDRIDRFVTIPYLRQWG